MAASKKTSIRSGGRRGSDKTSSSPVVCVNDLDVVSPRGPKRQGVRGAGIDPLSAISGIVASVTECLNVYNREKQLTRRVREQCRAIVLAAQASVERLRIRKNCVKLLLKAQSKDRALLKGELDRLWRQIEMQDVESRANDSNYAVRHEQEKARLEMKSRLLELLVELYRVYFSSSVRRDLA